MLISTALALLAAILVSYADASLVLPIIVAGVAIGLALVLISTRRSPW